MLGKTSELCSGHVTFVEESVLLTKDVPGLQECIAFRREPRTLKFFDGSVVLAKAEDVKKDTRHSTTKITTKKRNRCT